MKTTPGDDQTTATLLQSARRKALEWLARMGGRAEIDLAIAPHDAATAAMHICIGLAKDGLCSHEVISDHVGMFTLLPAGRSALEAING